jgi:parallel beta-helix repeat protein
MKKNLLLILAFLLLAAGSWAQNTVVTIGSGITASKTTGPITVDAQNPSGYFSRHIGLYTAAEINATPFSPRSVTKIAWYKEDTARYNTTGGAIKIYLKQTTATTVGNIIGANWTTEFTGSTEVYNVVTPAIGSGAGWKEFALPKPFIWNGTSNLEVLVEWTGSGTILNTLNWRYSPVTGNRGANTTSGLPSGIPITSNLPNIQFTFTSFNNDAGISAITSPAAQIVPNSTVPVQVNLNNYGFNNITTATIGWKLNNVAQPDYTWNGTIAPGLNQTGITLATQAFPAGAYTIKAYPKTVNGVADGLAANDTTVLQFVACSGLSGNYTINKNLPASATNMPSFAAAAQLLNSCGISGPVTITVAPGTGPYNESVNLVNISGTSATNTITFEGSGNTLTSANESVFKLDRANYVRINNLVITSTNTTTVCNGVLLMGPSNNAIISNCTINMPMNSGSKIHGIIIGLSDGVTAGNYSSNSLIQNNIINGGYFGVRLVGTAVTGSNPTGAVNNRIAGNQFRDFYNYGMYFVNADGTKIENNDFSRPTRTDVSGFTGINIGTGSVNTLVSKNRFHNTHGAATSTTSGVNAIILEPAAAVGSENIIRNNLFYDFNNTGAITAIGVNSATGVHIYHNTFSIENPNRPSSNTSTIKGVNLSGTGVNVKFINNIVSINLPGTGTKAAIYLSVATTGFITNNNVLYVAPGQTSAFIGYLTNGKATLTDWQAANTTTPYDLNSVAANPAFASLATGNLKPTSPDVNNIGQSLAAVLDDFIGAPRNLTTPDPGAYEFELAAADAGVTAFVSPTSPALPATSVPVQVTLKNFGSAPINSANIGWKVNGVMQTNFTWTGNLASNQVVNVLIGNYTFSGGSNTVCAWSKLPNGVADSNTANDSTCTTLNVCAPMAGVYTINKNLPTSATNFQSFTAAAERLHNCGVSARVVINVTPVSGPYTEQVDLLQIPGSSVANSVVFNGNGNTLEAAPTALKTTVLKLDNADYVRFHNLTINLNGTGGVGNPLFTAVQLVNNSDNDTISNCTITMPHTVGSNAYIVGIMAGVDINLTGNNTNNSVFMNNTISGGLYGIKINGNPNGLNAVNNRVIGNTILDGNVYGIALDNADGSLVESNEVKRPTLATPNSFYAISLNGASKNTTISKNRIHTLYGGQSAQLGSAYGLYFSGTGAPTGSENKVINNLINDSNTPQNFYGIYNNDASGIFFYHNTVASLPTGGFYGYYQVAGAASNIKFNNNIVSVTSGGGSLNLYAMYLGSPIETNNNVLYINPALPNANIGFFSGVSYATLATWKTANSNAFDQQSVSANPMFRITNSNLIPSSPLVNNIGKPLPAVTTDILNIARNAATPDPGAYEFTPSTAEAAVVAINSPVTGCGLTSQETVTITIQNFASVAPAAIPVSFQVDGLPPVVESFTGSLPFNATATYTFTAKANLSATGSHKILVKTLLPGDTDPSNDTLTTHLVNFQQSGFPVNLNFETPASGIAVLKRTTNTHSAITEGTGASNGAGSAKGMIMDGVDRAGWVIPGGASNPWSLNPENFAGAYICLSTANASPNDTLRMRFDLMQLFKASNANTNFRVTVNGTQVGPTYRPPFTGGTPVWQKITVDLSAYLNQPTLQVGFESSVKEAFANGTGTANLLDNIEILRITGPTGLKENALQHKVVVYPNPSTGLFHLTLPEGNACDLTISDLSGKVIRTQKASAENNQLDLSGTAKGIYLLKITNSEGSAVRKLIIE